MGHLNGILAQLGGNLNKKFQKSQMPGGLPRGGLLKLRFDRYITVHRVDLRSTFLQELLMWKESDSDFKKCQRFQVSTFC